jgi:hypothetical protein
MGSAIKPICWRGRFDRNCVQTLELDAFGDRPLRDHRLQPSRAELSRFLDQPVGLRPLHRRKGEPHVGNGLGLARLPLDAEAHALLPGVGDAGEPFPGVAVEHQQLRAFAQAHHIAEVIRLAAVELDARVLAQFRAHEQARQAPGRPGGRGGHRPLA